MSNPRSEDITELAMSLGYEERRSEASSTLFFEEMSPQPGRKPSLINIYYTTRSIMTYLHHPKAGSNQMWRSNAYKDLEELKMYFIDPRQHTGKGYRNKNKAVRGCTSCGEFKHQTEFSKNQWVTRGPDLNKCMECVNNGSYDTVASNKPISSKRFITLFNYKGLPYDDDIVCPPGKEFQRVLIEEDSIDVYRGNALSGDYGNFTKQYSLDKESFEKIFEESALVIIHDCMFVPDSVLTYTAEFLDNDGLDALVDYFENGGSIIIHCVEGIFRIGDILSSRFGCRWKLQSIESADVVLTERGAQLIDDTSTPSSMYLYGKVHFMRAPNVEGLVSKKVYTKDEFRYHYGSDSEEDEAYSGYTRREAGQHAVCVYEGIGSNGKLIWNGDRGHNPSMKKFFEKLLVSSS